MSEPVCEVCGKPATRLLCDAREVEVPGSPWRHWEPDGEHAYCDEHDRPVVMTPLPGRGPPADDLDQLRRAAELCKGLEGDDDEHPGRV